MQEVKGLYICGYGWILIKAISQKSVYFFKHLAKSNMENLNVISHCGGNLIKRFLKGKSEAKFIEDYRKIYRGTRRFRKERK